VRFMIIRKADRNTEAGAMPGRDILAAMTRYHEEMAAAGLEPQGVGLKPSSQGVRMKRVGGKANLVDGPFTETKELIAGFTIINAKSKEDALAWVRRWPIEDGDVEIEVRPLYEEEDFA
jgi:PhnB protein